jgi:endo-1,4-beta-xylanase
MHNINKHEDKYDYSTCKKVKSFADSAGMQMRAHNLIWPATNHNTKWVNNMKDPMMLKKFMDEYIINTVKEIGSVYAWDVINEIFGNSS